MKKLCLIKKEQEKVETKLKPCEMHGNGLNVVSLDFEKYAKYLSQFRL